MAQRQSDHSELQCQDQHNSRITLSARIIFRLSKKALKNGANKNHVF
jgi:hypothetical protein